MAELTLTGVDEAVLHQLRGRASNHGCTPEEEAMAILSEALEGGNQDAWCQVDAIYSRFAASGRAFSDSAELLRQDRAR